MCFYEKVMKVKADVAAFQNSLRLNKLRTMIWGGVKGAPNGAFILTL
jgi:hypothetical protein